MHIQHVVFNALVEDIRTCKEPRKLLCCRVESSIKDDAEDGDVV